ncbi:MAG TPA: hypothetical protein VN258_12880 [Mobilitalea sp.]|nr:hypothetical protein [Mobilitalea sp.]
MLSKLFKHEMKATARLLLPIYLILAVLTIMDRIVIYLHIFKGVLAIIPGFITFAYVISLIAIIVVSSVIIIIRFYKNLMTDEGYLMFTLPVKSYELINSKLLASVIWTVASFAGVIVSLLIIFSGSPQFSQLPNVWREMVSVIKSQLGDTTTIFAIEMILMIIISIPNSILMIYVSIAVGQFFNGHKVLGSFAAYIGISTAIQIFTTVITVIFSLLFRNAVSDINTITQIMFPVEILFLLVLNVAYYWVTNFIFNRKLNLD